VRAEKPDYAGRAKFRLRLKIILDFLNYPKNYARVIDKSPLLTTCSRIKF